MKTTKRTFLALVVVLLSPMAANADLIDNLDGTVTDDDLGIMWLSAPHMVGSNSLTWLEADGWARSLVFAGFDNWRLPGGTAPNDDPTSTNLGAYYYDSTGNELGHLFYDELSGHGGVAIDTHICQFTPGCNVIIDGLFVPNDDPDLALFEDLLIQPNNANIFWTSIPGTDTTLPCNSTDGMRWTVNLNGGNAVLQDGCADATVRLSAWAVRYLNGDEGPGGDDGQTGPGGGDGDDGGGDDDDPTAVPEPGTLALLGIGLFGMGLARRRKKV